MSSNSKTTNLTEFVPLIPRSSPKNKLTIHWRHPMTDGTDKSEQDLNSQSVIQSLVYPNHDTEIINDRSTGSAAKKSRITILIVKDKYGTYWYRAADIMTKLKYRNKAISLSQYVPQSHQKVFVITIQSKSKSKSNIKRDFCKIFIDEEGVRLLAVNRQKKFRK